MQIGENHLKETTVLINPDLLRLWAQHQHSLNTYTQIVHTHTHTYVKSIDKTFFILSYKHRHIHALRISGSAAVY